MSVYVCRTCVINFFHPNTAPLLLFLLQSSPPFLFLLLFFLSLLPYTQGSTSMEVSEPNPFKAWLGDPAWNDILALCELPAFKDFKQSFKANSAKWEDVMNVNTPFESVNALAGDTMDTFKKLCVLRCIRPDAVV